MKNTYLTFHTLFSILFCHFSCNTEILPLYSSYYSPSLCHSCHVYCIPICGKPHQTILFFLLSTAKCILKNWRDFPPTFTNSVSLPLFLMFQNCYQFLYFSVKISIWFFFILCISLSILLILTYSFKNVCSCSFKNFIIATLKSLLGNSCFAIDFC